jgi:hypothetical protein
MWAMEELLKLLQAVDPLWAVALVGLAVAVLLVGKLWRASLGRALGWGLAALLFVGTLTSAYYAYVHLEDARRLEERRALDERAALLFSQAVQPGSVFPCLDGSPAPAILGACEKTLFAGPQQVAAAVAIATQRIVFLGDAIAFARTRDPSYFSRVESLRTSVESDAYGFVAHVLSLDPNCTADACERFQLFRDPARIQENIRVRRFEAFLAKHGPSWRQALGIPEEAQKPAGSAPVISVVEPAAPKVEVAEPAASSAPITLPTAAVPPIVTPPAAEPPAPTAEAPAESATAAKGTAPAAAKGAPPRAAAKGKADAKAEPRRTSEPVGGLPRVVPSDFKRDKEDESTAQASGQPGAPISIAPQQQNFINN